MLSYVGGYCGLFDLGNLNNIDEKAITQAKRDVKYI